ncbi:hypothetical protein IWQ62_005661 [Dispira parvispora]|uniref:Peptidase S1 domain-containing protein n=1 Tax=Dispira parvispora TaxID=1520584 RepID=A0A9W8AJJ8_9FUNG|nr:hypothetical protein IWQ62_005661 [Dispira parvispora]
MFFAVNSLTADDSAVPNTTITSARSVPNDHPYSAAVTDTLDNLSTEATSTEDISTSSPPKASATSSRSTSLPSNSAGDNDLPSYSRFILALVNQGHQWQRCAGVLLAPTKLLTAAHCVVDEKGRKFSFQQLWIGHDSPTGFSTNPFVQVEGVDILPKFNPVQRTNDLAILTLSKAFEVGQLSKWPVHLNDTSLAVSNKSLYAVGWPDKAHDSEDSEDSDNKSQKHKSPVDGKYSSPRDTLETINAQIQRCDRPAYASSNQTTWCVATPKQRVEDHCDDNLSGLLLKPAGGDQWILGGIFSISEGEPMENADMCSKRGTVSVYTRPSQYLQWIESHTGQSQMTLKTGELSGVSAAFSYYYPFLSGGLTLLGLLTF